ncbi:hypothetical protein KCU88_g242, partial [Aureobasidium melanogenum]
MVRYLFVSPSVLEVFIVATPSPIIAYAHNEVTLSSYCEQRGVWTPAHRALPDLTITNFHRPYQRHITKSTNTTMPLFRCRDMIYQRYPVFSVAFFHFETLFNPLPSSRLVSDRPVRCLSCQHTWATAQDNARQVCGLLEGWQREYARSPPKPPGCLISPQPRSPGWLSSPSDLSRPRTGEEGDAAERYEIVFFLGRGLRSSEFLGYKGDLRGIMPFIKQTNKAGECKGSSNVEVAGWGPVHWLILKIGQRV